MIEYIKLNAIKHIAALKSHLQLEINHISWIHYFTQKKMST